MNYKERELYKKKINCFINDEKGQAIIKKIAPEVYDKIYNNPKVLEIVQCTDNPSVAGNYEIMLNGIPLYAGESGNVFIRACEHIYNMYYDEKKFGFLLPNANIEIRLTITHLGITDKAMREKIETDAIEKRKHLLQYTNLNASEYGNDKKKFDKNKQRWISRKNIPLDQCVIPKIRKERVQRVLLKENRF